MSKDRKDYGAPVKMCDADIEVIIDLLSEGNKQTEVASLMEVSTTLIHNIINGNGAYAYLKGTVQHNNLLSSLKRLKESKKMNTVKTRRTKEELHEVAMKIIELTTNKVGILKIREELDDVNNTLVWRVQNAKNNFEYLAELPEWQEMDKVREKKVRNKAKAKAADKKQKRTKEITKTDVKNAMIIIAELTSGKKQKEIAKKHKFSPAYVSRTRLASGKQSYLKELPEWQKMNKIVPIKNRKMKHADDQESISVIKHPTLMDKIYVHIDEIISSLKEGLTQGEIGEKIGFTQSEVSKAYRHWKEINYDVADETAAIIDAALIAGRKLKRENKKALEKMKDNKSHVVEAMTGLSEGVQIVPKEVKEVKAVEIDQPKAFPSISPIEVLQQMTEEVISTEKEFVEKFVDKTEEPVIIDMAELIQKRHRTHYLKWDIKGDLSLRYHMVFQDRNELEGKYILKHHELSKYTVIDSKFAKLLIKDSGITDGYIEVMGYLEDGQYIKFINSGPGTPWTKRNEAEVDAEHAERLTLKNWTREGNGFTRNIGSWQYCLRVDYDSMHEINPYYLLTIRASDDDVREYDGSYDEMVKVIRDNANIKYDLLFIPTKASLKKAIQEEV